MSFSMNHIALKAYAKINLSLYITGVRDDGYHLIDSVFVPVNIYDAVDVLKSERIEIESTDNIPLDSENTAYKAAELFSKKYNTGGAYIKIKKGIPQMAGLGGGSADAAAVLIAMNELYSVGASRQDLVDIGIKIGADVPFFLGEGAARVQGIGEKVIPIDLKSKLYIVLIKPYESLSTQNVFKKYDDMLFPYEGNANKLVELLEKDDVYNASKILHNDLERPAVSICSEVMDCIDFLKDNDALAANMTGSGSCVFGIFLNAYKARNAIINYYGAGNAYIADSKEKPIEINGY
jgi:4-diphosphocytidyl-2-C-methyl-D-erythritol kinase